MDESTARSRHPDSIGQAFLWAFVASLVLLLIALPTVGLAQIVTNITPTQTAPLDLGREVDQVGSTTEITGGTRPGNGTNLFHSFDLFTLGTSDIAHFMNDMQLPTSNVLARVIGGEASTIDGTLQTNNPLNAPAPICNPSAFSTRLARSNSELRTSMSIPPAQPTYPLIFEGGLIWGDCRRRAGSIKNPQA